jgi:hypothetical protein
MAERRRLRAEGSSLQSLFTDPIPQRLLALGEFWQRALGAEVGAVWLALTGTRDYDQAAPASRRRWKSSSSRSVSAVSQMKRSSEDS